MCNNYETSKELLARLDEYDKKTTKSNACLCGYCGVRKRAACPVDNIC